MSLLHFDVETFSEASLDSKTSVGTHNYFAHPSTQVTLFQWSFDNDPHVRVEEGPLMPDELRNALLDETVQVVAFNAEFERVCLRKLFGIDVPMHRWICTMARAWAMSFVGGLDKVGQQMGFPVEHAKLKSGRRVMLKFGKPRKPSKLDPSTRWTKHNAPDDWALYIDYARQDVVASRMVYMFTARYPTLQFEQDLWCLDQRINDQGWPVDLDLVNNANRLRIEHEAALLKELKALTKLPNPNSVAQLTRWLAERGCVLPNMQKETVSAYLDGTLEMPIEQVAHTTLDYAEARDALHLRQELARATPKKWNALKLCTSPDGRIRATLEFAGAQRTNRWSGRAFQPHNLYTERVFDTDVLADNLTHANLDTMHALYPDVMAALSGGIRPAITAKPGHMLVVVDYKSIESVLLGWHSGEERINRIFREGGDTYKDLASRVFNVPVDQVTKQMRTFCKPPELGCGYYLGARGLVAYADGMGVTMTEDQAKHLVSVWRDANPAVVKMWKWLSTCTEHTISYYSEHEGYGIKIFRDIDFLFIELPSGRRISYYEPLVQAGERGTNMTYMGRDDKQGGGWYRITTHGGKITENIIQACARDVLADGLMRIDKLSLDGMTTLVGHVHDEPVQEVREDLADAYLQATLAEISRPPSWLPGCFLGAEGDIIKRYKKL